MNELTVILNKSAANAMENIAEMPVPQNEKAALKGMTEKRILGKSDEKTVRFEPKVAIRREQTFIFNKTRCHNHLIYGEGIQSTGVNGTHNKDYFYRTLNDKFAPIYKEEGLSFDVNECIESLIPYPLISGIDEIYYKLPALNGNNTLNKGIYRKIKYPKQCIIR